MKEQFILFRSGICSFLNRKHFGFDFIKKRGLLFLKRRQERFALVALYKKSKRSNSLFFVKNKRLAQKKPMSEFPTLSQLQSKMCCWSIYRLTVAATCIVKIETSAELMVIYCMYPYPSHDNTWCREILYRVCDAQIFLYSDSSMKIINLFLLILQQVTQKRQYFKSFENAKF